MLRFDLNDDVWLDVGSDTKLYRLSHVVCPSDDECVAMVLGAKWCFLHCMSLNPVNQSDPTHPRCRIRPDQGLDAISQLNPGVVTGPLSVVWKRLIDLLLNMGQRSHTCHSPTVVFARPVSPSSRTTHEECIRIHSPTVVFARPASPSSRTTHEECIRIFFRFIPEKTLLVAPYDFRLAPMQLESRDHYFTKLRQKVAFKPHLHLPHLSLFCTSAWKKEGLAMRWMYNITSAMAWMCNITSAMTWMYNMTSD
eukprot:1193185-Amorphochlora_amoeboformis.AAC.4